MFAGDAVAQTTNKLAVTEQEARACVEYYPSEERTKNLSKQTIMLAPAPPDSDDERDTDNRDVDAIRGRPASMMC